jgi:hypothetical protein
MTRRRFDIARGGNGLEGFKGKFRGKSGKIDFDLSRDFLSAVNQSKSV